MTKFKFTIDVNKAQIEGLTPAQAKALIQAFSFHVTYTLIVTSEYGPTFTAKGDNAWSEAMHWMCKYANNV